MKKLLIIELELGKHANLASIYSHILTSIRSLGIILNYKLIDISVTKEGGLK